MTEPDNFSAWLAGLALRQRISYALTWRWYNWAVFPGLQILSHLWYRIGEYFGWLDEIGDG